MVRHVSDGTSLVLRASLTSLKPAQQRLKTGISQLRPPSYGIENPWSSNAGTFGCAWAWPQRKNAPKAPDHKRSPEHGERLDLTGERRKIFRQKNPPRSASGGPGGPRPPLTAPENALQDSHPRRHFGCIPRRAGEHMVPATPLPAARSGAFPRRRTAPGTRQRGPQTRAAQPMADHKRTGAEGQ